MDTPIGNAAAHQPPDGQVGIAEGRIADARGKLLAFAATACLALAI